MLLRVEKLPARAPHLQLTKSHFPQDDRAILLFQCDTGSPCLFVDLAFITPQRIRLIRLQASSSSVAVPSERLFYIKPTMPLFTLHRPLSASLAAGINALPGKRQNSSLVSNLFKSSTHSPPTKFNITSDRTCQASVQPCSPFRAFTCRSRLLTIPDRHARSRLSPDSPHTRQAGSLMVHFVLECQLPLCQHILSPR